VLILTNPLAGRAQADAVSEVAAVLAATGPIDVIECETEADLDATLDRRAGRAITLVGGDGSLHSLMERLWHRGEAADCPIGLVPMGTGNDFARGVGIPLDPMEAAQMIVDGKPAAVDLITDDAGGVVVNAMHVGVGADAAVVARPLKPYLRTGSFPIGALLAGLRAPGWRLRVEVDGRPLASGRRRVLMAGLANAPTIAGGMAQWAPGASVADGYFDVIVSTAVGPLARAGYAVGLVRGTHSRREDVVRRRGRTLSIAGEPFHANADGEVHGPLRHRVWTMRAGAWRCILPPV
jgi:diacylglycerol kinase (ATP)